MLILAAHDYWFLLFSFYCSASASSTASGELPLPAQIAHFFLLRFSMPSLISSWDYNFHFLMAELYVHHSLRAWDRDCTLEISWSQFAFRAYFIDSWARFFWRHHRLKWWHRSYGVWWYEIYIKLPACLHCTFPPYLLARLPDMPSDHAFPMT